MSTAKKSIFYVAIGVLVLGAYVGLELYQRASANHERTRKTLAGAVKTVAVVHAKPADTKETMLLPGNIQAWYEAPIYAQVSGYVKMWYKDYGAKVKEGDVLAEINAPALDAQYAQAKAGMSSQRARADLAALTAQRYEAMQPSHAVSQQSINVREAEARAAQAELRAQAGNVGNFAALMKFKTVVAPYDGVVIARNINVGDYVTKEGISGQEKEATDLFRVADVHKMRLFVSVPEQFGPFLQPGLKAEVTVPQFPSRTFVADFLTVARGFDPNTRTAITEFTIDNSDEALWPGSYASVRIAASVHVTPLQIPATALVFQEPGTQVATVTGDHKVHFKTITVTKIGDGVIDVLSGVTVNDAIIDHPSAALLEGSEVRVVKPAVGFDIAVRDDHRETK